MQEFISFPRQLISSFHRGPVLKFLHYCEDIDNMPKRVLDCGGGGKIPPISFFASLGYRCAVIDMDRLQLKYSKDFCDKYSLPVSFELGDMRSLPYPNNTFSFVFSFNTIFHMRKDDIYRSIKEIARVTSPGGLIYFNLLTKEDSFYGEGTRLGPGEYEQNEHDGKVIHSYFENDECDHILAFFELVCKDERKSTINFGEESFIRGDIDYFLRMPGIDNTEKK